MAAKKIKISSLSEGLRKEVKKHIKDGRTKMNQMPSNLVSQILKEVEGIGTQYDNSGNPILPWGSKGSLKYKGDTLNGGQSINNKFNTVDNEEDDNYSPLDDDDFIGDSVLQSAMEDAKIKSEDGYVVHVNKTPRGDYALSDWYDDELTVASYENGRKLNENNKKQNMKNKSIKLSSISEVKEKPFGPSQAKSIKKHGSPKKIDGYKIVTQHGEGDTIYWYVKDKSVKESKTIKLSSLSEGLRKEVKKHINEGKTKLSQMPNSLKKRIIKESNYFNSQFSELLNSEETPYGYQLKIKGSNNSVREPNWMTISKKQLLAIIDILNNLDESKNPKDQEDIDPDDLFDKPEERRETISAMHHSQTNPMQIDQTTQENK